MSYENCGSAHQIDDLDHEFDNSAIDLNKLLDGALSRKHSKHEYEDPIIHHFSRYNSNHLIRLHAADKSFNSYEGGSVAELTNIEIHRDENDFPINHHSNSSTLQNRIDTRDRRPQSDAPLQNIHENSKLSTNKSHTSSAKRLDVLEDQQQDGNKVPHYFKDQYQNSRKTSAARDDYGFSGEFNKNSHSEANQSHPYNNNSLTDSEKISEIMHMAYLKGRGQGTEPSDGGAGIEFMSKEPSMIELSNKDFENSPKATEEDDLEEYKYDNKYEESEQQRQPHHHVQISTQLREILVPISQAENESEDSDSERIHPSDLIDNENGNNHRAQQGQRNTENLSESQNLGEEVIAIDNRKGSLEYKRDEKAMRGQRNPTEVSPNSASESIDEFVASRFSGISPRDPRGSITKGDILTEGQLFSSRSQKEEERVETQENRETEGDQLETHERIQEQSEEEEEIENFKTCQSDETEDFKSCLSQELFAEAETGVVKRMNQGDKYVEETDVIHEQEEEEIETPKGSRIEIQHRDIVAEIDSVVMKRVNQEEKTIEESEGIQKQTEEENVENIKRSKHQGEIVKETEDIHQENNEEIENIKKSQEETTILGDESQAIKVSNQEQKFEEETDGKSSHRKENKNLAHADSSKDHQKTDQSKEEAVNVSLGNVVKTQVQENEAIESAQVTDVNQHNHEDKIDSNNVESNENKQSENIVNEAAKRAGENSDMPRSEVQDLSERRPTLEENIQENDQSYFSAIAAHTQEKIFKTESSENADQYFSDNNQKKEIKNENQTEKVTNSANDNNVQESIQDSENKVGNQNRKEIDSSDVENIEKKQAENNSNEKTGNEIEQGSEMNESEVQGNFKGKQDLEENSQKNAEKDSSAIETKTQEELVKAEKNDQSSSEAIQNKEENAIHSGQGDAQEDLVTVSENKTNENKDGNAIHEKEKVELNNAENQENEQNERVEETRNVIEQDSEVHRGTSETKQALSENVKEDSQRDSSAAAQEKLVKNDVSQQMTEAAKEKETNIDNKAQNTARSVHDDIQKESIDSLENRVDSHGEEVNTHDKNLINTQETKISSNTEKKALESAEEQNHQATSNNENENQKVTDSIAEAGKRSDGEDVLVSEQKGEKQEIGGEENKRREATLEEETKEAREEHKKSSNEGNMKEGQSGDLIEESEGGKVEGSNIESVKELEGTEATARNLENDADNLTETQNETNTHLAHDLKSENGTEKPDEKLISAIGSIKEFEGEEGNVVNQNAQIITEEISAETNTQQQEVNETEKRQNKLVPNAESVKESEALEATVVVENKLNNQEETSGVQVNSSESHRETAIVNNTQQNSSTTGAITQESEIQNKQEENGDLPTDQQEVKSNEGVTSNAVASGSIKDSETLGAIVANQESHVASHIQTQNEAVQQKREIEKSQEKLASEAVEGSSIAHEQEEINEEKIGENNQHHHEAHHKEEENVNEESASQEILVKTNKTSEISSSSNVKNNQETHYQQHQNENSSSNSGAKQEERFAQIQSVKHESEEALKKDSHLIASETTKINSTHHNTIDENHKSSSEIITHNILDMTTQTNQNSEIKRSSNTTSPQKDSILDHNDKLQMNKLLEEIQEEESKENMISPQHFQTQQEQPTQEYPNNVAVSTPVKSKRAITTTTASTGTDFILHKTQIEEKGTQTEAEAEPEVKEVPSIIPVQKVTHFRSLSSTKKKQRSTFRLFEKSVGEYEKDIDFMSKYTTKEVMQHLDQTPEQMEALFESAKKLYKIGDETPRGPPSDSELDGILNRVVVARSPVKEGRYDHSLIPIYQQVEETYEDGTRYEGEKFLGKRHGTGTYYYKEGYKFVGNWEQDVMSGFGTLWLTEDQIWYEGEWANNVFHGRGSLYNTNPEKVDEEKNYLENFDEIGNGWKKYEGQFLEGKRHRFGTILFSNGDVFVGNFKENKAEGRGSYTKVNKKMIVGEWCDNKLKKIF